MTEYLCVDLIGANSDPEALKANPPGRFTALNTYIARQAIQDNPSDSGEYLISDDWMKKNRGHALASLRVSRRFIAKYFVLFS